MPLTEFKKLSQEKTGFRRLFSDSFFDLYLWYASIKGKLLGFQLVMKDDYHAFTWDLSNGGVYSAIMTEGTPLLTANGFMPKDLWLSEFKSRSANLEPWIIHLVEKAIHAY